jgi:hypothetical protein
MTVIDTNIIEARYDELLMMPMDDLLVEVDAKQMGPADLLDTVHDMGWPTEEELIKHLLETEFGPEALDVAKAWDEAMPLCSWKRGGRSFCEKDELGDYYGRNE